MSQYVDIQTWDYSRSQMTLPSGWALADSPWTAMAPVTLEVSAATADTGIVTRDKPAAEHEYTDDGHYLIVDGRRWQATDPAIPEKFRKELVAELMAARRDVRTTPETARPRVQDAKVALGERGEPWWQPTPAGQRRRLESAMRVLLRHRPLESTICPSDAARTVGGTDWRKLMTAAREVAGELANSQIIEVRQGGQVVELSTATGPIRLARGPRWA